MAKTFRGKPGGMKALMRIIRMNRDAMAYDLLTLAGAKIEDIGGKRLPWTAFKAFVKFLPPDSATNRVLHPDGAWGLREQLEALIVDLLVVANWQRAGGKGAKPKPLPRPGFKDQTKRSTFGSKKMSIDEMRKKLG